MKQEEVQELHLTDDLADSLMNTPTEPEQSDEEPNLCTHVEMKTETEQEVLLEDQEVQGITEAVEELAKNKESGSNLSEEVELVREKSPQLARSLPEASMKVSPMPETLVMEEEHCEKTENATTSLAADLVEKTEEEVAVQETLMEVDTVKEAEEKEEVAQTTVGDNETVGEAPKGNKQQSRGPRNNRQGGKRTWEKERKKEKKVEMEKRVAAAEKSEETAKTTMSLSELPKKSYSSAMKSNLVEKAGNNSSTAAAPKPNSSSSQRKSG